MPTVPKAPNARRRVAAAFAASFASAIARPFATASTTAPVSTHAGSPAAGTASPTMPMGRHVGDQALARRLDAVVERWIESGDIVGGVILVNRDARTVYRRTAGFADRERGLPVTQQTVFRLASMTKLIVAATALALVERGKLSLAHRVDRWLPYFRPALADGRRPPITLRHLMTHTAGLGYDFLEPDAGPNRSHGVSEGLDQTTASLEENVRRLSAVPLYFEPGTEWRYSIATDVLGAVVAKATGASLAEAVHRYVTGPLGMDSTGFGLAEPTRLAVPYRSTAAAPDGRDAIPGEGAGLRPVRMDGDSHSIPLGSGVPFSASRATDPSAFASGGAGACGTAADYLRLLEALRTGGAPILGKASAALLAGHAIGHLRAWTEGMGWGFGPGGAVLLEPRAAGTPQNAGTWQWGGVLGGHWFVDPAAALSVVVLTNTAVAGVIGAFPDAVREAVYGMSQ